MTIEPIARFVSPFTSKFGVPKQSGLVPELRGKVVFAPAFRNADYLRGIEHFDYLWLLWEFSANRHAAASPLVRPPLLGGNEKVGVFASRSPFRPNALGLSSVRLASVEHTQGEGPVLWVEGADLMDGTPIFDIKPYVEYADAHTGIRSGFVDNNPTRRLKVVMPDNLAALFSSRQLEALLGALSLDPRPHYHNSAAKVYGRPYAGRDVRFKVDGDTLIVVEAPLL